MGSGVVLFGGSFNPIHIGHLITARSVMEHLNAARLVFIPSRHPPHKDVDDLANAADRMEMVSRAIAGEPGMEVSDAELKRDGPSYTVLTVKAFRESLGVDVPLYWMIGGDSLADLHNWYQIAELVNLCRVVTAVRPGFEAPDLTRLSGLIPADALDDIRSLMLPTPRIDISATEIRRRLHHQQSIRYLVPSAVREYIMEHALYVHC